MFGVGRCVLTVMPAARAGRRRQDLVNHIDHLMKIAGIDHAGLGRDYDGVNRVPTQMNFSALSEEQRTGRLELVQHLE